MIKFYHMVTGLNEIGKLTMTEDIKNYIDECIVNHNYDIHLKNSFIPKEEQQTIVNHLRENYSYANWSLYIGDVMISRNLKFREDFE